MVFFKIRQCRRDCEQNGAKDSYLLSNWCPRIPSQLSSADIGIFLGRLWSSPCSQPFERGRGKFSLTELCDCLGPLGWSRRRGQESLQWSSHQGKRAQVLRIFITRVKKFLIYEVLYFSCNFLVSGTENYYTITSGWLSILRRVVC